MSLKVFNLYSWSPESIDTFLEDTKLKKIAREVFKEDFADFREDGDEGMSDDELFEEYISTTLRDDEYESFMRILEGFIKEKKLKAVYCDAYLSDNDDLWTVYITQVIPQTKEDLTELLEIYAKENNMEEFSELLVDHVAGAVAP